MAPPSSAPRPPSAISSLNGDEKTGADIVARAVEAPLRQLVANAGREAALIVEHVKNDKDGDGYNVATDKFEDLIASGVVDPTKVTRTALQNAASISGLLLTTECLITDLPAKEARRRRRRWPRPRHGRHGRHDVTRGRGGLQPPRPIPYLAKKSRTGQPVRLFPLARFARTAVNLNPNGKMESVRQAAVSTGYTDFHWKNWIGNSS